MIRPQIQAILDSISKGDKTIWESRSHMLINIKLFNFTKGKISLFVYCPIPNQVCRLSLQYQAQDIEIGIKLSEEESQELINAIKSFLQKEQEKRNNQKEEEENEILNKILSFL